MPSSDVSSLIAQVQIYLSPSYWYNALTQMQKKNPKRLYMFIAIAFLLVTTFILILVFGKEVLVFLESLSESIIALGTWGYVIMFSLTFVVCFPIMWGYSLILTLSGFTYGLTKGFLISYSGALSGAMACFLMGRYVFGDYSRNMLQKSNRNRAIARVLHEKGFAILLAIRILPFPFSLFNTLFGAMDVSFFNFTLATALSLVKILTHIYLGSTVKKLSEASIHDLHPVVLTCVFTIPVVIFIPTSYYFWKEVNIKMRELDMQQHESSSSILYSSDEEFEFQMDMDESY